MGRRAATGPPAPARWGWVFVSSPVVSVPRDPGADRDAPPARAIRGIGGDHLCVRTLTPCGPDVDRRPGGRRCYPRNTRTTRDDERTPRWARHTCSRPTRSGSVPRSSGPIGGRPFGARAGPAGSRDRAVEAPRGTIATAPNATVSALRVPHSGPRASERVPGPTGNVLCNRSNELMPGVRAASRGKRRGPFPTRCGLRVTARYGKVPQGRPITTWGTASGACGASASGSCPTRTRWVGNGPPAVLAGGEQPLAGRPIARGGVTGTRRHCRPMRLVE
ncbi:hypothetical protein FTUN_8904 [Frigoriglobus tundricola]|uniref:Uncharacterized protein n=1 Tax=Frigoriglobus tundricola TaxID=2774151 RepID=A0A6M5Z7A7_9BACT|nr:hypothetical protein FTUN_8904 [Frigoriglobus tundricola]